MKKYIILGVFPISALIVLSTLMTILNLFNIEINKVILTILMITVTFISGFILGKKINDKGYLKGLIYGLAISLSMFLLSIILLSEHSLYNIIYYLIITSSTTLGCMFSISRVSK